MGVVAAVVELCSARHGRGGSLTVRGVTAGLGQRQLRHGSPNTHVLLGHAQTDLRPAAHLAAPTGPPTPTGEGKDGKCWSPGSERLAGAQTRPAQRLEINTESCERSP